ncbi:MAG: DUF5678 domain-containing protein [Anaerolineales bacterium]
MLDAQTIDTVQSIAVNLKTDERMELIRLIIEARPEKQPDPQDEWRKKIKREARYWYSRPMEERQPYLGEFVAVYNNQIVDHDRDLRSLYLRVRKKFPNRPVLLVEAGAQAPPEFTIRSPRLEKFT